MFKLIAKVVKGAVTAVAIDWVVQRFTGKSVVDEALKKPSRQVRKRPKKVAGKKGVA